MHQQCDLSDFAQSFQTNLVYSATVQIILIYFNFQSSIHEVISRTQNPNGLPLPFFNEKKTSKDYRKLNQLIVDFKYLLSNISDLLEQFKKYQYFSAKDLACDLHLMEFEPKDISKKQTINSRYGRYCCQLFHYPGVYFRAGIRFETPQKNQTQKLTLKILLKSHMSFHYTRGMKPNPARAYFIHNFPNPTEIKSPWLSRLLEKVYIEFC